MFSKTCTYAIRAMLYLAAHTDEDRKMRIEEIAKELEVPKHFLAKILQQLTKCKLASSMKGPNGGFYLSQSNKKASLLPVIEQVGGPQNMTRCVLGLPACSSGNPCMFHEQALEYRHKLLDMFWKESIGELGQRMISDDIQF